MQGAVLAVRTCWEYAETQKRNRDSASRLDFGIIEELRKYKPSPVYSCSRSPGSYRIRKKTRLSERSSPTSEKNPPLVRKMTINPMLVQKAVFVRKSNTGPDSESEGRRQGRPSLDCGKGKDNLQEDCLETSNDFNYTLTKIRHIRQEDFRPEDIHIMNANSKYNAYRLRCNRCAINTFIISLATILLIVLANELVWYHMQTYSESAVFQGVVNSIRMVSSGLAIASVVLVVIKHRLYGTMARHKNMLPPTSSMFNLRELPWLVVEFIIAAIHVPPFVDNWDVYNPRIRYAIKLLTVISFLKLFFIIEVTTTASPINSQKGKFIGSISGIDYTQSLLFKTWLKQHPWTAIYLVMAIFIFAGGYLADLMDREASSLLCSKNFDNAGYSILDRFWMLVITFQTVGYGDIVPFTQESRIICVLCAIAGGIFTAFMIGLVRQTMSLTKEEENIYSFVENHINQKARKDIAARLVTLAVRLAGTLKRLEYAHSYPDVIRRREEVKDRWNTRECRRIEWDIYIAMSEWRQANKSLKNPHELQNGLDIIFSINSMMDKNERQLEEMEDLLLANSEEKEKEPPKQKREVQVQKEKAKEPEAGPHPQVEEQKQELGPNRRMSDTNMLHAKTGSEFKKLIPRLVTIKRGFTIISASNTPTSSKQSSGGDSSKISAELAQGKPPLPPRDRDNLKKVNTMVIRALNTKKEMESIEEHDESDEAIPSPASEQRIDTESPFNKRRPVAVPASSSAPQSTFKKLSLRTPRANVARNPVVQKEHTRPQPDIEASPIKGGKMRRNNRIMNISRGRQRQKKQIVGLELPTTPSAFLPKYSPQQTDRKDSGDGSENSLLSSSRYGSLTSEQSAQKQQITDKELMDSLCSSRKSSPLKLRLEGGKDPAAILDKPKGSDEREDGRLSTAAEELEEAETAMDELDRRLDGLSANIAERMEVLKSELVSVRGHRQTYLQFNVINNVSMMNAAADKQRRIIHIYLSQDAY